MHKLKPHPNKILFLSSLFGLLLSLAFTSQANDAGARLQQGPEQILDALHRHAAEANWDDYFALYLPNASFIGTDASEHWDMAEFERYARPTKGWRYSLTQRKMTRRAEVVWFDEILMSDSYGVSRGTGTLIMTDTGWKIAQYHLSFPVPNAIAREITSRIIKSGK